MTNETVIIRKADLEALIEAVIGTKVHSDRRNPFVEHTGPSLNMELTLGLYRLDETVLGRTMSAVGGDAYSLVASWEAAYGGDFGTGIERMENVKTSEEEDVLMAAEKAGHVFTDRG
jgi:hypothetical protein